MREQLDHLIEVAALPTVTIQVLPFAAGHHPGMTGPFAIFGFPDADDIDVVYLEHAESDLYLEHEDVINRYMSAFKRLHQMALTFEESVVYLRDRATQLA